jgi:predicted metal-dependent hydrolase
VRSSTPVKAQGELGFDYTLKCSSKRRSVAIAVRAGEVSVSVPMGVCELELQQWLMSKCGWVLEKLQQQNLHALEIPNRHYGNGDSLFYLGAEYPLRVTAAARSSVSFSHDGGFVVALANSGTRPVSARVHTLLQTWFKRRALELLRAKTQLLCARMNLTVNDVCVRRTKSKWGHCTSKGVIQYNWLILCAPESVVDYLIAHEVCHLRHHNHSRAFWRLVKCVCQDYTEHKVWLQRYGHTLIV